MSFSQSFFEVTAQLIPVLFLATVVEERLQPDADQTATDRVARSWLMVLFVIGEMISLAVVAGGLTPSKGEGSIVASTLMFSAFLLALPVLEREMQEHRSKLERLAHASAAIVVILAILWTLGAIEFS
jgi:hypothetical protein